MTGAEREPDALVEARERLAALLPEAGFPTLLGEVVAVVGDALRQARAEEAARADAAEAERDAVKREASMLADVVGDAWRKRDELVAERDAALARVAELEATVARVGERILDTRDQFCRTTRTPPLHPTAKAYDAALRAALSPAQGETETTCRCRCRWVADPAMSAPSDERATVRVPDDCEVHGG